MTMQELKIMREKLLKNMFSGSQVVEFEDRRIERRSVSDIQRQLLWVESEIDKAEGCGFKRVRTVATSKDL